MEPDDAARASRVEFLEHQVVELERLASDKVLQHRAPGAVVSARSKAAELRGQLDELRASKKRRPRRKGDQAAEVLDEVRRLRMAAAEAGSFVPAANLLKLELELVEAAESRRLDREREQLAHLDGGALVLRLVEALRSLPPQVRERVRAAVFDPVH